MTRLGIFATHPIQYQVPVWRLLSRAPGLEVRVFYFSDYGVRPVDDSEFGVNMAWDVPLLDGYPAEFLSKNPDPGRRHLFRIPQFDRFIKKHKFDWVFINGYMYPFERQLVFAARNNGYRVFLRGELTNHPRSKNIVKKFFRRRFLRYFYRQVDAFGYIGRNAREHLQSFRIAKQRLFFTPYCIDNRYFENQVRQTDGRRSRERMGLGKDLFVFIFSGKMIARKDPFTILRAVERMQNRDRTGLIVLGDGELKRRFYTQAAALLGDRLVMPGFVNQSRLGGYFAAANAFILPSVYETWGLVVNEAMQFGLPVIVSDRVGCRRDLVMGGETGFVFPAGNAGILAACMDGMVKHPENSRRMGQAARKRIEKYTAERAAAGILQAMGVTS